jgi:hypothetical protein
MSTHIYESTVSDKIGIGLIFLASLVMFVLLTQPAWHGEAMAAEFKSDCAKRGGVLLEHKKTFGTSYECVSRLD